jgi:hypothetical protein
VNIGNVDLAVLSLTSRHSGLVAVVVGVQHTLASTPHPPGPL